MEIETPKTEIEIASCKLCYRRRFCTVRLKLMDILKENSLMFDDDMVKLVQEFLAKHCRWFEKGKIKVESEP
ncbi:hypothetical protein J7L81_03460 [Candidatus Aerophobetes bacterium]|nr:hypothetical protein [Candidatus Aerophobetes bacterium]